MHEEFHGSVFFLLSAFGLHRHAHLKQDGQRCDSAAGLDGFIQRVKALHLITVDLHLWEETEVCYYCGRALTFSLVSLSLHLRL